MTVRIKFAKYGNLKFLSHLDVLRFFQKAVRRAEIDVKYSEGYHPHQIMSFAAPLGVGQTSEAEYFDMDLNSFVSTDDIMNRLNGSMTEGFRVLDVTLLPETPEHTKKESVMALVSASDYLVLKKDGNTGLTTEELYSKLDEFFKQKEIYTIKTTKTGDKEINIREFIYDYRFNAGHTEFSGDYDNSFSMYLLLSAGSENHIRPELVMKAFYEYLNIPLDQYAYQVHRLECYTGPKDNLIPVYKLHKDGK